MGADMQQRMKFGEPWHPNGVLKRTAGEPPEPALRTPMGWLFEGDCLKVLPSVADASIDTVFADPPFNLGKKYGPKVDDSLPDREYVAWCKQWIDECVRVIKPGGAFFLYNLPKWNIILGAHMAERGLTFRHWVAIGLKVLMPIPGRLYPAHYSLLYYTKGKPKTFRNIRVPIQTCRHCGGEVKDYGGHRAAMNPNGVNLSDIWEDIPPVRHWKFKSKNRKANQLSTKLVNRAVQISTQPGDVVLDPFGGSGTTFDVCERAGRHWVGVELENVDVITERMESADLHHHGHDDYVEETRKSGAGQKRTHQTNKKGG